MYNWNIFKSFTKGEWGLWIGSLIFIMLSFCFSSEKELLTLIASLIGVTALIFIAKGDVIGQVLTCVFSLFYAVISFRFHYYGEMITYLGMTSPIALLSVVSWLKHPYKKNEVEVASLKKSQFMTLGTLTIFVTWTFYFVLKYFETVNLCMSTISIATSFMASALMFLRSPYYAIAYASNDMVLILLWIMASIENVSYLPMVLCFMIFLVNDLYGFVNWKRMQKRQHQI